MRPIGLHFLCRKAVAYALRPFGSEASLAPASHPKRHSGLSPTRFTLGNRQWSFPAGAPPLSLPSRERGGPPAPRGVVCASLTNAPHLAGRARSAHPPPCVLLRLRAGAGGACPPNAPAQAQRTLGVGPPPSASPHPVGALGGGAFRSLER